MRRPRTGPFCAGLAVLLACVSGPGAGALAQLTRGLADKEHLQRLYRMGDDADEKQRVEQARKHTPSFATPEDTFKSWQRAIVLSDKKEFFRCLHPDYLASKYPDGEKNYVKHVEYLKYHYLGMYARLTKVEVKGDQGHHFVEFSFRRDDGSSRVDREKFPIRRHEGRWLIAGQ